MEPENPSFYDPEERRLMRERLRTPAQAIALVWGKIKQHRETLKSSGVKVGMKWFHSDADSRIQQIGLVMMGANVPAVPWKTLDGTLVTMTPVLAGQIFQATAQSDMAIFAVAESHLAGVNAAADPASYDWSTGWPAGFIAS